MKPGKLLTVDDSAFNRFVLTHLLRGMGHEVEGAENGTRALELLQSGEFDLVLLDLNMPGMDGHSVLDRLRSEQQLRDLPVIVVTALEEVSVAARCIEAGAEDYLTKPVDPLLLRARINACLEKKRLRQAETAYLQELLELRQSLETSNNELRRVNLILEDMAYTDPLTRLPNRRFAIRNLGQQWELFRRNEGDLCCIMCDIDHFKSHNDLHGHDFGDEVLRRVAELLQKVARAADLVCRFGGEEFLVLCPDTDLAGAVLLAERLRQGLETLDPGLGVAVTASFGVAQANIEMQSVNELIRGADRALYQAKAGGRNRVVAQDGS